MIDPFCQAIDPLLIPRLFGNLVFLLATIPSFVKAHDAVAVEYRCHQITVRPRTLPTVFDTGASLSITSFASNFINDISPLPGHSLHGVSSETAIAGIGSIHWPFSDPKGNTTVVETIAYHVPSADIRLSSPQVYFEQYQSGGLHPHNLHCS